MDEEMRNIVIMGNLVHGVIEERRDFGSMAEASAFYDIAYGYCSRLMALRWQKGEEWRTHHLSRQEQG